MFCFQNWTSKIYSLWSHELPNLVHIHNVSKRIQQFRDKSHPWDTITQTWYYHIEVILSHRGDNITQRWFYHTELILLHRRDTITRMWYYHVDVILSQRTILSCRKILNTQVFLTQNFQSTESFLIKIHSEQKKSPKTNIFDTKSYIHKPRYFCTLNCFLPKFLQ